MLTDDLHHRRRRDGFLDDYDEPGAVDLDELDRLFDAGKGRDVAGPEVVFGKVMEPDAPRAVLRDAQAIKALSPQHAWSAPQSTAFWTALRRSVRTVAPFFVSDLCALVLAAVCTHYLMRHFFPAHAAAYTRALPLVLLPLVIAYWLSGLYLEIWVHPVIELRQMTHLTTFGLAAAGAGAMIAWPFPLWCLAAWPFALTFVPLGRGVMRTLFQRAKWWGYPTLVIGSGPSAVTLARALIESPKSGLRPVLLTDPRGDCRTSVMPVVNDPATLRSLVQSEGIRHAAVCLPEFSIGGMSATLDRYSGVIPHLLVLTDTQTLPALWSASRQCGRLSGIEVRNGLLLASLLGVKRALDVVVAVTGLICGLPLLAVITVVARLTDPGPIFFGHTRIGRHGRKFKAWKFRSMRVGGDAILRDHLARNPAAREEWEATQKLRHDPRVTRLGAFLRRSSLDELPQLWNVLRGDMSIVGPRPIVDDEVRRYGDVIQLYATVKPGITGLWQVSGRNNVGYEDRVLLDQFYARHWSPWLDVFVIAKTVITLIKRDGY